MGAPAHLVRSRHGVFYLRWPIPAGLHPAQKASDVKISLRTKERKDALRLSRYLGYEADRISTKALDSNMRYDEIRSLVREHFKSLLDTKKEAISVHGRLSETDLAIIRGSLDLAEGLGGDPTSLFRR